MNEIEVVAQYAGAAVFAAVSIAGVKLGRRGSEAGWRAAAAFGSLALILLIALFLPEEDSDDSLAWWFEKSVLALLLVFPFLLYRFTAAFHTFITPVRVAVLAATVVVMGVTLALPQLPDPDEPQPGWVGAYIVLILGYWTLLTGITAFQLWRAGKGHPTLTRRRMRLMGAAAITLNVGLLIAVSVGNETTTATDVVVQLIVVASGAIFLVGLSPPRAVRFAWRLPEEIALRSAISRLMEATSVEEVADILMPQVMKIVGASAVSIKGEQGEVVAASSTLGPGERPNRAADVELPLEAAGVSELDVWTSRYTPFFGRDEVEMLSGLAAVADLAFERCHLLQSEREARGAAEESRETAERANLAKSDFLSRMSHELRTPLNVILGFAQVMETSDLDEEDRESVEHIIKAGRHLLDLINEVLDLSRIESGTLTISPEPVLADELVSDTLDLIRPAARDRHIDIVETAETCEAFVRADRQRFKQVLLNVLSNAVKYNRDGGKIFVSCSRGEEDLQIKIRDTGPGIPTAFMDKLFEPFERLGAEALKVEGTGLGLSLSRQLVEVMGGTIDATNSDEGGAEFTIELPLDTSPAVALEEAGARSEQGDVSIERPGRTILLIEDNLTNLRLVERILRSRPEVALIPAMQGQLGLELAREHNPDLILLDLHLPDLSGFEVLNRLRADPRTRGSPVVVVSADASPGQVRRLLDAGAAEYLTKPLELTRFFETLDAILGPETAPSKARSGREP